MEGSKQAPYLLKGHKKPLPGSLCNSVENSHSKESKNILKHGNGDSATTLNPRSLTKKIVPSSAVTTAKKDLGQH